MNLIELIVQKMSSISTPLQKFLVMLLFTIQLLRGKMTFRNLSWYSGLYEKTYARHFQKAVDFVGCNKLALRTYFPKTMTKISDIDCSFTAKYIKIKYNF